jgi:hypothetical protein
VSQLHPTGRVLAATAIAWLAVGLSTSAVLGQVGSPKAAPAGMSVPAASPGVSTVSGPAASPGVSAPIETGDPRSDGQGPGLVGEPLLVLAGIALVGLATVIVTIVIARATGRA